MDPKRPWECADMSQVRHEIDRIDRELVDLIAERFGQIGRILFGLYPMVGVIEGFRSSILGSQPMPWDIIGVGIVSALVICGTGVVYFKHMEQRFADVA